MRRIRYTTWSMTSLALLAVAWLSWLHTTVVDPKFICVEVSRGVSLESLVSGCCAGAASLASDQSREADNGDCGDCEDLSLHLMVITHRHTLQRITGTSPKSEFTRIDPGPTLCAASPGSCGFTVSLFNPSKPVHVPVHLRTGVIPQIC